MTQQDKMNIKAAIIIVLFIPIWFFVYAFFHEAGHALLLLAYGGTIESFVFWNFNAHVSATGTEFTPFAAALNRVAGELFPRILGALAIAFYRPKVKHPAYHICYFVAVLSMTVGVLVAWVYLPIRSMFAPVTPQDITHFLDLTGFHPLIVALTGLFLISAFVLFAHSRGIFANTKVAFYSLLQKTHAPRYNHKSGIIAIVLLLVAGITFTTAFHVPYEPPSIFNVSASIADVREETHIEYTFSADEARQYHLNLMIQQNLMTGYIVQDNEGNHHRAGTFTGETTSLMSMELSIGVYTMRLIFLTDFEAVIDFLEYVGAYDYVDSEDMQNFRDVFNNNNNDDFSVIYSLRIR